MARDRQVRQAGEASMAGHVTCMPHAWHARKEKGGEKEHWVGGRQVGVGWGRVGKGVGVGGNAGGEGEGREKNMGWQVGR